jgi:hypothetical protein
LKGDLAAMEVGAHRRSFRLKRELDFGDILTSVSILVSVIGLGFTWVHDQHLKTQTYADEIRKSAAAVTGKLERWTQLSDLYFADLMPSVGAAGEEAAKDWKFEPANGHMYNALQKARFESSKRIAEEELEISYMELYRYVPELQSTFDETIKKIREAEDSSHNRIESALQDTLRNDLGTTEFKHYDATARQIQLGNDLRGEVTAQKDQLHEQIEQTTRQLRAQMLCLINLPSETLRDPAKRKGAVSEIAAMRDQCPVAR